MQSYQFSGPFDAHCHLSDERVVDPLLEVSRAQELGVQRFFIGGVDPSEWVRQQELSRATGAVLTSYGLHPWYVNDHDGEDCVNALTRLEEMLPEADALGEAGLDFGPRCKEDSYARQIDVLQAQLTIAKTYDKPVIIHAVKSHHAIPAVLRQASCERGMVHGFQGSFEVARSYLDLGFNLSFGTSLLDPKRQSLVEVFKQIPRNAVFLESDCPDGYSGVGQARNFTERVLLLYDKVADLWAIERSEVEEQIVENLQRMLVGEV